jgi:energy-coupling factor transporter ATP-binding protein EcfA2
MLIEVHRPSPKPIKAMIERFALQRDDWNDRSFQTLYHLHYRHGPEATDVTYIGAVKILKRGQTGADVQFIQEPFTALNKDFCSVGQSLDYYQRLNQIPERRRNKIMRALNDAVAYPELVEVFEGELGWKVSVFRDNRDWRAFLDDATILYRGNFSALPDIEQSFSFRPGGSKDQIDFQFSAPEPEWYFGSYRREGPKKTKSLLPARMFVLIGRNGSGKSTLLSRLAHLAFASPQDRKTPTLRKLGRLEPDSIGFMRVITISYSAFDSFVVPGASARDLSQITQDLEEGEGRFVFCGLRDIAAERRDDLELAEEAADDDEEEIMVSERRTTNKLKPVGALADEFVRLMDRITRDDRRPLFEAALTPLLAEPSFADLRERVDELFTGRGRSAFLAWSTGHKIALHVVASLVANATPRSLVLFDEPEAHLHPPMMAALMHAVRLVLNELNAFCVVATHSPVLLQETLGRHVRQIERNGKSISVSPPTHETFGENVGVLTYNTFRLTAASTDFHKSLDLLIEGCDTFEQIEGLFEHGLSGQARAYVLAGLAAKEAEA